ncbi:MAG: hypothetical protein H6659_19365 [Ardenticatenaceae bacterium]|nr:hypothetical protein [Ardenticatenaceae bacterium]
MTPFIVTNYQWSLGLYAGKSPFDLKPIDSVGNPIITADDVTDVKAGFVADPFLVHQDERWYLFFEVLDLATQRGVLAMADSVDGLDWTYRQVVLAEPYHLSYPHVFNWNGRIYMMPETPTDSVFLYRAVEFPLVWEREATLIERAGAADSTPFFYQDHWWMLVGTVSNDTLYLYHANTPLGPWTEHPMSPLLQNEPRYSRPGGRVFTYDGRLYRVAQDGLLRYGHQLHLIEITELTTTTYAERLVEPSPWLAPGNAAWNSHGMHQVDLLPNGVGQWLACVDGYRRTRQFQT